MASKWNSESKKLETIYDLTPVYEKMVKARSEHEQAILPSQEEITIKVTVGKAFKDPNTGLNIVLCPRCWNKMSLFLWQGTKRCLSCGQGIGKIKELAIDHATPQVGILIEDEILHVQHVKCPICDYLNTLTSINANKTCSVCSVIIGSYMDPTTEEMTSLDVSELLEEYKAKFTSEEDSTDLPLINVVNEERLLQAPHTEGVLGFWDQEWQVRCTYCGYFNEIASSTDIGSMKCSRCSLNITSITFDEQSPLVDITLTPLICPKCGATHDNKDSALSRLIEQHFTCECGFSFLEYLRDPQHDEEFYQGLIPDDVAAEPDHITEGTRLCPSCFTVYDCDEFECPNCNIYLDPLLAKENGLDPYAKQWAFSYDLERLEQLVEIPAFFGKQVYCPTCDTYHDKQELLSEKLQGCPLDGTTLTNNRSFCESCSIQYPTKYNFCMQCGTDLKLIEFEVILPKKVEKEEIPPIQEELERAPIYCHGCRQEHAYEYLPKFCKSCGREISSQAQFCASCNVYYPSFYKFCQECGKRLEARTIVLPDLESTTITDHAVMFCHSCRQAFTYYHAAPRCYVCSASLKLTQLRYCKNCQINYPDFYKFCQECGAKLSASTISLPPLPKLSEMPVYCEKCDAIYFYQYPARYCKKCGTTIKLDTLQRCSKCLAFNKPQASHCKKCGAKTYTWIPNEDEISPELLDGFLQARPQQPVTESVTQVITEPVTSSSTTLPSHLSATNPSSPSTATSSFSPTTKTKDLSETTMEQPASIPTALSSSASTRQEEKTAVQTTTSRAPQTPEQPERLSVEHVKTVVMDTLKRNKFKILNPDDFGYKIDIMAQKKKQLVGIQVSDNPTTAMMDDLLFTGFPGKWLILVLNNDENQPLGNNQLHVTSITDVQNALARFLGK